MNGHRRTGKPVFPKTRQIKKRHPPTHPTARRGMCEGGTIAVPPSRLIRAATCGLYKGLRSPASTNKKKTPVGVFFLLVEARRVELLSENQSARLSTSVAVPLTFPLSAAGQQAADFSSSRYNHGPGALPVIVHHSSTPSCGRGPPQSDGCLIKQRTRNQC